MFFKSIFTREIPRRKSVLKTTLSHVNTLPKGLTIINSSHSFTSWSVFKQKDHKQSKANCNVRLVFASKAFTKNLLHHKNKTTISNFTIVFCCKREPRVCFILLFYWSLGPEQALPVCCATLTLNALLYGIRKGLHKEWEKGNAALMPSKRLFMASNENYFTTPRKVSKTQLILKGDCVIKSLTRWKPTSFCWLSRKLHRKSAMVIQAIISTLRHVTDIIITLVSIHNLKRERSQKERKLEKVNKNIRDRNTEIGFN